MCFSDADCLKQYGEGPTGPRAVCDLRTAVCIAPAVDEDAGPSAPVPVDAGSDAGVDAGRPPIIEPKDGGGVVNPSTGLSKAFCSVDGMCWLSPSPQGNTLLGAWAVSDKEVWSVGEGGTVLHWNGVDWESTHPPTDRDLYSVWVGPAGEVWTVGLFGTILRFDGTQWLATTNLTSQHLYGVSGDADGNVYVVGSAGTILERTRTGWASVQGVVTKALHAVWVNAAGDVFAVGEEGMLAQKVGGAWSSGKIAARGLNSIAGDDSGLMIAVGDYGTISERRTVGGPWNPVLNVTTERLNSVRVSSGASWAVGTNGLFARRVGGVWSASLDGTYQAFNAVVAGSKEWFAFGRYGAVRRLPAGTIWAEPPSFTKEALFGARSLPGSQFWIVGDFVAAKIENGTPSTKVALTEGLKAVSTTSAVSITAVGDFGALMQWDGSKFSPGDSPAEVHFKAIWEASNGELLVGGSSAALYGRRGVVWERLATDVFSGGIDVTGIWGASNGSVFAVGSSGLIITRAAGGGQWSKLPPLPSAADWTGIWGDSSGHIVVVGYRGMIARRTPQNVWSESQVSLGNNLMAVCGTSITDVWAVGMNGTVLRYDGSQWNPVRSGTTNRLLAVACDEKYVVAAGEHGTILQFRR